MADEAKQFDDKERRISEVNSVMAHQLQIPLAGIKGAMEVLLSGDLGALAPEQKEYVEMTLANTEKVIMLVKDILDASRIEEHALAFSPSVADLETLIREALSELELFAKAKNSTLDFKVSGEIPALFIDAAKIRDVVHNLVYNAIRYNIGKGDIHITLERKGQEVIFSVADHGVGIPSDEAAHIFQKFFRTKKALELSPVGSGLGLFISHAVIDQSGGKIWFESREGEGSTFYFSLPVNPSDGQKK
jgi:signal transduction histidine kinase